jgi:hypothetical protein
MFVRLGNGFQAGRVRYSINPAGFFIATVTRGGVVVKALAAVKFG